ncbi:MAG TPA: hypothetical protein VH370_07220 [Humisphaera sp.]|nr:hypothetical protein [Humisphaera sp.]
MKGARQGMRAIEIFQLRCKLTLACIAALWCASAASAQQASRIVDTQPSQKLDRSIVFVCDATATMVPKFMALKLQLSKAINDLGPLQRFDVIFFNDDRASSFSSWLKRPGTLPLAVPATKSRFNEFFAQIVPRHSGSPIAAVELAIKEQPDVIYLLSDGEFEDADAGVKHIRELNPDHKIRINTIAFINNDEIRHHVDVTFKKILKQIADENGGTFKDVNPDDL